MDGNISEIKELTKFFHFFFPTGGGVVGHGVRVQTWHVSVKHPVVTSSLPGLRLFLLLFILFFASMTEPLKG